MLVACVRGAELVSGSAGCYSRHRRFHTGHPAGWKARLGVALTMNKPMHSRPTHWRFSAGTCSALKRSVIMTGSRAFDPAAEHGEQAEHHTAALGIVERSTTDSQCSTTFEQ